MKLPQPEQTDQCLVDPEFTRLVEHAPDIAASGRWAAVNARVEALAANAGPNNEWWVQLFASLCAQNFSEHLSLKRAYENNQTDDAPLLAWHARNLLELSVWSTYCAKEPEERQARVRGRRPRRARHLRRLHQMGNRDRAGGRLARSICNR